MQEQHIFGELVDEVVNHALALGRPGLAADLVDLRKQHFQPISDADSDVGIGLLAGQTKGVEVAG